jgi:lipopolysaccharide/colanic/teichoic acid biosynthesis glycosyltransferase
LDFGSPGLRGGHPAIDEAVGHVIAAIPGRLPWTPNAVALAAKRTVDVTVSGVLLILGMPLLLVLGIAILIDSGAPVFFVPNRVGHRGRRFRMFKFRSMVKDAENRLSEVAHLNVGEGMVKIPDDPRVTGIGRFMRRFSLDELPQLINVFRGDMSLIGPRPHDATEDIDFHDPVHHARTMMRPGITGLWQVSSRASPDLGRRIRDDLQYVRGWSLALDFQILWRTLPIVLGGRGGDVAEASKLADVSGARATGGVELELA